MATFTYMAPHTRLARAYNKIVVDRDLGPTPYNGEAQVPSIDMIVQDGDTSDALGAIINACAAFIFQSTTGEYKQWKRMYRSKWAPIHAEYRLIPQCPRSVLIYVARNSLLDAYNVLDLLSAA